MNFLLDTCCLLWALSTPEKLSSDSRAALEDTSKRLWVSPVSFFEITTKVRSGKLVAPGRLLQQWEITLARLGASVLELSVASAIRAGSLDWEHRDPFDRLLAAQAIEKSFVLVTADPALRSLAGLQCLW